MAEFKETFSSLSSIPWSSVPLDKLEDFLHQNFSDAEVILNSVPVSLPTSKNGGPVETPSKEAGWKAAKAIDTLTAPQHTAIDDRNASNQKQWGTPIKLSAKDNPLGVSVFKMAASDRHGAWFGRRSVHTGLGFTQWKHAMRREFIESLKVKTGPGAGAVRGIAGDRRLEKHHVAGLGIAEVWQLSSAFPGPVTPREFNTLLLTSDKALSEASSFDSEPSSESIPRHFVIVSRPTTHDDVEPNKNLVQGTYESTELIREIPGASEDPESNPVEWIMVTRSDPGGGIPKFLVERNTPASIVADVPKLIDWAINIDDLPEWNEEAEDAAIENEEKQDAAQEDLIDNADASLTPVETAQSDPVTRQVSKQTSHQASMTPYGNSSLLASLSTAIGSTISPYIPSFNYGQRSESLETTDDEEVTSSSLSDVSDGTLNTYASAPEHSSAANAPRPTSLISLDSTNNRETTERQLNSHEKELEKLSRRRSDLDARLAKARADDERKAQEAQAKDEQEGAKALERRERELKKAEEKYNRDMEKLHERRRKEEQKAEQARIKEEQRLEERKRKAREKDGLLKAQRERDEAREKLEMMKKENEVMQAQIEELQRENNVLVQKLGTFGESGVEAVKKIREEAGLRTTTSSRSLASSHKSKDSKDQVG